MTGIPPVPPGLDRGSQAFLNAIKHRAEVGEGQRGDPLQRYLKIQDLLDLGLAKLIGTRAQSIVSGDNLTPTIDVPNPATPPAPTGFTVTGGFNIIHLEWDKPSHLYTHHAFTYIYRHTTDNIADAVIVGQAEGMQWVDVNAVRGVQYYYWIRFVSTAGRLGPPNSSVGTLGQLSDDPTELLLVLSAQITETQLYATLNNRIDLIDTPVTGLIDRMTVVEAASGGSVSAINALDVRVTQNESDISAQGTDITGLLATVDNPTTGVAANALGISSLDVRVTATENTNTSQASQITVLQSDVAGKNRTFEANNASPPTATAVGDIWIVTDQGNRQRRWNGTAWVDIQDSAISGNATAISALDTRVTQSESDISAQAASTLQLQTDVAGNTATLQTQATSINGLEASYTVKIDVNGHVAGYGLASTTNQYDGQVHSTMLFSVNTFAIAAPGAAQLSFVVDNGQVVMDGALIKDATINTAQVGSIAVDKIVGLTSSFLLSNIGTGNITNAYIGQIIESDNYVAGFSGWRINKDGTSEFRNILARGDIEASTLKADAANIVSTLNLQGQALTFPIGIRVSGTATPTFNTWHTAIIFPYNNTGSPVVLMPSLTMFNQSGSNDRCDMRVRRQVGSGLIATIYQANDLVVFADSLQTLFTAVIRDDPTSVPAQVTYYLDFWSRDTLIRYRDRAIIGIEVMRT